MILVEGFWKWRGLGGGTILVDGLWNWRARTYYDVIPQF
jgi:hypothetical protein